MENPTKHSQEPLDIVECFQKFNTWYLKTKNREWILGDDGGNTDSFVQHYAIAERKTGTHESYPVYTFSKFYEAGWETRTGKWYGITSVEVPFGSITLRIVPELWVPMLRDITGDAWFLGGEPEFEHWNHARILIKIHQLALITNAPHGTRTKLENAQHEAEKVGCTRDQIATAIMLGKQQTRIGRNELESICEIVA